jgi:hypothetical protein
MPAAVSGSIEELERVQRDVLETEQPAPPPPEPEPEAIEELIDVGTEHIERIANDPKLLEEMSEEDIAAFLELCFGLMADWRGPHWELPTKNANRLAKWIRRSIERHGGLPEWFKKYFPDLMCALLVSIEIGRRIKVDKELAAKKKNQLEVVK